VESAPLVVEVVGQPTSIGTELQHRADRFLVVLSSMAPFLQLSLESYTVADRCDQQNNEDCEKKYITQGYVQLSSPSAFGMP